MSSEIVHHIPNVEVRFDLLCPHPTEPRFLVLKSGDHYELPHIEPIEHHTAVVDHIERLFSEKYGLSMVAVRILAYQHERDQKAHFRLYQLVNWQDLLTVPAGFHWLEESELEQLVLAHEAYRNPLETWFAEKYGRLPIPEKRVPWARSGWYLRIRGWIEQSLTRLGFQIIDITLYRAWGISAGLWVETDKGRVYVKVSPSQFLRETSVTAFLAQQDPTQFPHVLDLEESEGWLMMLASPIDPLIANENVLAWEHSVNRYARHQQKSRQYRRQLSALGCQPRGPRLLAEQIERLLDDERWLRPEPEVAFSDDEQDRFRQLIPELKTACRYWAKHGLEETLVHGDFHPGNILLGDDGPIFIDWSDACWSHPFIDMVIFTLENFGNPAGVQAAMGNVVESYLQAWVAEKPIEELRIEYDGIRPVAILFHALTFAGIVTNFEDSTRWEMHNVVPWMLRQLLAAYD